MPFGAFASWLLPPSSGLAGPAAFTVGLWLALAGAGIAVIALVDQRSGWRIALGVLAAIAAILFCAVPVGGWWTFTVEHGDTGAASPAAAVTAYLYSGPLGSSSDELAFNRALCDDRRSQLRSQAATMRRDIETATTGTSTQFLRATRNSRTTVHGDRATVTEDVALLFTFDQRQADGVLFNETDAQPWTFELVNDGGWRVCSVAAPEICTEVLDCDRSTSTPSGMPSSSPTDDLLSRPREMLPCGPRDPFRERHSCPPDSVPTPVGSPS